MGSKVLSISLTEAQEWKLNELARRTGISRSGLIQKALLLLISELGAYQFRGGLIGSDVTEEDLEKEFAEKNKR